VGCTYRFLKLRRSSDLRVKNREWTFLTNHAHVLICIVDKPEARMRDIAERVAITERAVQRIIRDLESAGYVQRIRTGRRNRYKVRKSLPLRHAIEKHRRISALLRLILDPPW
jgi:DNA-binding MarR family transcriptional regulator